MPGVTIFFKQKASRIAIQESRKLQIPTICILDTDCDPDLIDFGIPINDDSITRTKLFLETILPSIQEGRRWWIAKIVKKQKKISFCAYEKRTRTYTYDKL
jgi:small subunit ribosomal protein S2